MLKSNLKYSFLERITPQLIQVFTQIILAFYVEAKVFGTFAIIMATINVLQIISEGGFVNALLSKGSKDISEYRAVLSFNLLIAFICIIITLILSKFIKFQNEFAFSNIYFFLFSLFILITCYNGVVVNYLVVRGDFKFLAKINIFASLSSSFLSIFLAINQLQLISLISSSLFHQFLVFIFIIFKFRMFPRYSDKILKNLLPFSISMLFSGLIDMLYNYFINIFIFKKFSLIEVGKYNRSRYFNDSFNSVFTSSYIRVILPHYANLKNEINNKINSHVRSLKFTLILTFAIYLLINGFYLVVKLIFWKHNWFSLFSYFQIISPIIIFYCLDSLNLAFLRAMGKHQIFFIIEIFKKIISCILMMSLLFYNLGIKDFISSLVFLYFLNLLIGFCSILYSLKPEGRRLLLARSISLINNFIIFSISFLLFVLIFTDNVYLNFIAIILVLIGGAYYYYNFDLDFRLLANNINFSQKWKTNATGKGI